VVYERQGGLVVGVTAEAGDGTALPSQRFMHDGLESVVGRVPSTGGTTRRTYDAWGNITAGTPPGAGEATLAYAGQHWDADVGLSYAQQRWYEPGVGRFLSEDPLFGDPRVPVTLFAFGYANGNPTGFVDPDGRFACWLAPGVCDPARMASWYIGVRSMLGEENQARLDKYALAAIQGYFVAKDALGRTRQLGETVVDEAAYVHAGGNWFGNLQAAGESAVGKFVLRTGFGVANLAMSSPQVFTADLVDAHARVGDTWSVATDSSKSNLQRVEAGAYILDMFSQDLLMVAGTMQAGGVRGPMLYTPKPRILATEVVYGTEVVRQAAEVSVPHGFTSAELFGQFGAKLNGGLADAGYADAHALLQGSAVTGRSFRTGTAFDVGRVSDFDIALSSPTLLARARELGVGLRSAGTRTGPLSAAQVQQLGLGPLQQSLSQMAGRPVNFMIYGDAAAAAARAPSVPIP